MTEQMDLEKAFEFLEHVFGFMSGAVTAGMIHLGDKLGLYKAMDGAGPVTSQDLAERTGLDERWLREWLRGQGAAGVVEHRGDEVFELTPEQAAVLADEEGSPLFAAGAFGGLPGQMSVLTELPESFRTGVGLPFDAQGRDGNEAVARMFAPWFRHMLVPVILPGIDGVVAKLTEGAKVADVGCGAGVALVTMAKAYPASEFHGYDISKQALALAEENRAEAGVDNLTIHDASTDPLPEDGTFDLVTSFDCIHDMTHPQEVIAAVRRAVSDDGTYLIADVKSYPTYEENLESNPMVAMEYGFSILSCMSSALSEPGGAGLGTLGFHEPLAREMAEQAGFSRFTTHDFGHPANRYYELRP